ncbi:spore germination protein GerW family protein [Tepidiforma flava]|uniref:Spore germination protein GerW family protein n=1 Tax=Tepidiforma flava TaxID=3004094 RepID=A0ABY7M9G1_9CHLR|nr:spore germination protein GerW family protein [Tepidiforma flava]WBL37178.1 spore germination protein GerW family protein [Tepidiforma flava]
MTDDLARVLREAQEAASSASASFVERIAARIGLHASAAAVFGDPVDRDGVTVVPVAKVRWGFGGGAGRGIDGDGDDGDIGEGSGAGGGVMASPVGYIEIQDGQATFHRIKDPASLVPVILAGAVAGWLTFRGLAKLLRG